eukprot:6196889-Pleurochrysis_carterae.AAC.4
MRSIDHPRCHSVDLLALDAQGCGARPNRARGSPQLKGAPSRPLPRVRSRRGGALARPAHFARAFAFAYAASARRHVRGAQTQQSGTTITWIFHERGVRLNVSHTLPVCITEIISLARAPSIFSALSMLCRRQSSCYFPSVSFLHTRPSLSTLTERGSPLFHIIVLVSHSLASSPLTTQPQPRPHLPPLLSLSLPATRPFDLRLCPPFDLRLCPFLHQADRLLLASRQRASPLHDQPAAARAAPRLRRRERAPQCAGAGRVGRDAALRRRERRAHAATRARFAAAARAARRRRRAPLRRALARRGLCARRHAPRQPPRLGDAR